MNLDWLTCIQKFKVPLQVTNMTLFKEYLKKDLHLNLNLNQDTLLITL
jgi:hypothetical protein